MLIKIENILIPFFSPPPYKMLIKNIIYQGQYKSEKTCLEEELCHLEDELAYIKEEIIDLVAKWFFENDIEPDCVLNEVQKNLLNYMLHPIKTQEKMLEFEIKMCLIKAREFQRH